MAHVSRASSRLKQLDFGKDETPTSASHAGVIEKGTAVDSASFACESTVFAFELIIILLLIGIPGNEVTMNGFRRRLAGFSC